MFLRGTLKRTSAEITAGPMSEPVVISPRVASVLLRNLDARRLRIAFRADTEIYSALLALAQAAMAYETCGDSVNGTEIVISGNSGDDSHMNVREVSRRTGKSERVITKAIADGRLKAHRGGGWCVHAEDLATWIFNMDRRERFKRERDAA